MNSQIQQGKHRVPSDHIAIVDGGPPDDLREFVQLVESSAIHFPNLTQALDHLRTHDNSALLAHAHDPKLQADAGRYLDSASIIEQFHDGIAVVDHELKVLWSNCALKSCNDCAVLGSPIGAVLGCAEIVVPTAELFDTARKGGVGTARIQCGTDRWIHLRVTRAPQAADSTDRFVIHVQDVTSSERRRQKLAALQHAGRALNNLDADQLAEMSIDERTEVLKHNIRQFLHALLNYDVIDLRILDRSTGRLLPLIEDGMLPIASTLELFAREQGSGVTGHVASTGRTYLCRDTAADSRYIQGAAGAKSSLTVPLLLGDEVIGTLNIESPKKDAFTETDVFFTEAFAREIAQALHTLELLAVEKSGTALASVEAVSREVALPADEILNTATSLLGKTPVSQTDTVEQLRRIIANVRSIKQSIRTVGESVAPPRAINAREAALALALHGKYVLVADSDERVRRAAHLLLEKYGCHVEAARNRQEAIDMAQAEKYDAFMLDIHLPDGKVSETYFRLRELQPAARPILMTGFGYDSSHVIVKARQAGAVAVLFKPFRNDQVLDALAGPAPATSQPQPVVP